MTDGARQVRETSVPRVTVLMPVHNGRRYLRQAIESILHQSFREFEFLIINDGSSDDSRAIILSYDDPRICLIENPTNVGLTKSLNRGLAVARGSLIARQDADDISQSSRLEKQVEFLDNHPQVALLGTQVRTIDGWGRVVRGLPWPKAETELGIRWQLMFDSPLAHTSAMFRREVVWEELGGYSEDFITSQDYELWSRVAVRHGIRNLPDCLVDFRLHSNSVSTQYKCDHIQKVRNSLLSNAIRYLQSDRVPDGWPDIWIRINNSSVFGRTEDIERLIPLLDAMHTRFTQLYPEASSSQDIRRHVAGTLARIACIVAGFDRRESVVILTRAFRTDATMARGSLLRYLTVLMGGQAARNVISRILRRAHNR